MFGSSITPIYAEDTSTLTSSLTPTISGDTSGNQVYTIKSNSSCDGSDSLSGTDAQVFATISREASGTVVCAKSDGFRTEVSGNSDISNYHWVAWYKNSVDEKPDTTNDTGNYRGFKAEKVQKWSSDSEWVAAVKNLNGGAFPEIKDYTYPTDTTTSKLEFWGDIAGYYSILGDPQYKKIHLTAYQQFSYKTKQTNVRYVLPPVTDDGDDDYDYGGGSGSSGGYVSPGTGGGSSSSGSTVGKITASPKCPSGTQKKKDGWCYKKTTKTTKKRTGTQYFVAGNSVGYNTLGQCKSAWPGRVCSPSPVYTTYTSTVWKKIKYVGQVVDNSSTTLTNQDLLGKITKNETSNEVFVGYESDGRLKYETYTYTWATQEAKVAECDIAKGAYATELGTMPRIALKAGSGSNYTIKSSKTTFWNTTPGYWTDKGVLTAENNSSLPYHFESEADGGTGVNNVNLYSVLTTKDKLFTIVHGYPEIPNYPKIPPYVPETCAKVGEKETCSDDNTPPEKTTIDPNDDDGPQAVVEADKSIRLTQSPK